MSIASEAANRHIVRLLEEEYPPPLTPEHIAPVPLWVKEYRFHPTRKWRLDYAVPSILCAIRGYSFPSSPLMSTGVIEIDGGTFVNGRHATGVGLRGWREKARAAASLGWRIWYYAPEEIVRAGRKTIPDERILKKLPWM